MTVLSVALAAAVVLTQSACSSSAPVDPDVITVAVRAAPSNLDPRIGSDEASQRIAQLVFSSLFDIGDDLRITPHLALRLDNPDPLTYIVPLHRGVKFHDGHELTARDVIYTYTSMMAPDFISPYKGAYRVVDSIRALDDYTVEFRLKEPFPAFPIQLVTPAIVANDAGTTPRTHPIGTGPYEFVRYAVDDFVELRAFPDYWEGAPSNAGVTIKVIPDDTMRGLEMRKRSVDLVFNDMLPDVVHQLERTGEVRVARSPGLDLSYLGFNMRDPVLSDKRVRHAIGYAIDREAIVRYLRRGLARPAYGLIPEQSWAFEPDVLRFTHDPARAMQLLDEAGYKDPDGDGPMPRLRLSLKISTNEEMRLQGTVIQQDLARVGIELDIRSYEFATFYADVLKGNFQIFSLQWIGGALIDPDILRRVFHSQQAPPVGFNRGYYSNPEVDRAIEAGNRAVSEADRKKYYGAAQKLIAEDAPYIPIWNKTNAMVVQPTLRGLHMNPIGDFVALKDVVKTTVAQTSRLEQTP